MATKSDPPAADVEVHLAAAAAAGSPASLWARHGREDLQGSHSLTAPLARWTPGLAEHETTDAPPENESQITIPASVLHTRPALRLPEDAVCRSPIAGLVIAVMAAQGQAIARREPVLIIEAMKMQNNVSAEVDGVVKVIHVATGDAVKAGQILFELA